jgi:putative membrane protein (TIGR04086 family)
VAVIPAVDRRAVVAGATVGLVVAGATILAYQLFEVAVDVPDESSWPVLFSLVIVGGWVAAGWVAGRRDRATPFTAGGLAALASLVAVGIVGLVVRLASGDGQPFAELAFFAIVATVAGIVGAALSAVRR